jgi:hypothetical protein
MFLEHESHETTFVRDHADEMEALACWRTRKSKTWAFDVEAGPARGLAYRQTVYVRAHRDGGGKSTQPRRARRISVRAWSRFCAFHALSFVSGEGR